MRARESHPDARPGVPDAAEDFKAVAEAYRVLSSPELRLAYDAQLRPTYADALNASWRTQAPAPPPLTLRVTSGAPGIGRLHESTRFYLLGELLPARTMARAWSAPVRVAVLLDRSSSMRGPKIFEAKRAVKTLFGQLGSDDRLSLLLFDDRVETLLAGESPLGAIGAQMALDNATTRGATQLGVALEASIHPLEADIASGGVAALLLITDGRTYGDEERCLAVAERARLLGVPIITFGLGLEWNRDLLDRIAALSGGSCTFVEEPGSLTDLIHDTIARMQATLADNIRLELEPAPGVRILRASVIAPEVTDVYDGHSAGQAQDEPIVVKPGTLTTQPALESVVALWEVLLDPGSLTRDGSGAFDLGSVTANWSTPSSHAESGTRLSQRALVAPLAIDGLAPLDPEARLALELLTAHRLQAQADQLATAGATAKAATALNTAALRLREAGAERRADETQQAASSLLTAPGVGLTATLRVKYAVRNQSAFHHLRRRLRERLGDPAP